MTKLQFISLLVPAVGSVVLVLLAWLHQNQRFSDLRADMRTQFAGSDRRLDRIEAQMDTLASDYRNFYGMEQKLEGRVDELSKRIA